MPEKYSFAFDYKREEVELVRQTCLYIATKLGDLLDDLVVVGGLVPSLLIPDESLPAGEDVHIGTTDLDLGLSLALLDKKRYEDLSLRLYRADFKPDENEEGKGAEFFAIKQLDGHSVGGDITQKYYMQRYSPKEMMERLLSKIDYPLDFGRFRRVEWDRVK